MVSKQTAVSLMIGLLSVVLVFHFCVLLEVISYKIVWAGKLESVEEMRVFETVSILVNISLLTTLYLKSKNLATNVSNKFVNGIIWVFVFLFALNTVANLFANSLLEQVLGTSLTLISTVLCWIIVRENK